jgi:hypothetical protein
LSSTSRGQVLLTAGLAGQLLVGFGALLALLTPIWFPLSGAGVVLMLLGIILAAPEAGHGGPYLEHWWNFMAVAALVCLTGFALEFVIPVIGGVLLSAGGVTALVAAGLGAPPRRAAETD